MDMWQEKHLHGSSMGAMLDTVADLIFTIAIIKLVYPLVISNLLLCICCIVIAVIKVTTIIAILKKCRKTESLHTNLNKLTGAIIFISIFFINTYFASYIFVAVCIIATITAIIDLLYSIKPKKRV